MYLDRRGVVPPDFHYRLPSADYLYVSNAHGKRLAKMKEMYGVAGCRTSITRRDPYLPFGYMGAEICAFGCIHSFSRRRLPDVGRIPGAAAVPEFKIENCRVTISRIYDTRMEFFSALPLAGPAGGK